MDYKNNPRSPHMGKLFAYDATGKQVNEFDMLKVRLIHENSEFTVRELLERVFTLEKELKIAQKELQNTQSVLDSQKEINQIVERTLQQITQQLKRNSII